MTIETGIIFCGIVFIGAIIQGISGFAFSMVVLAVFPYIFGYTKALIMASMLATLLVIYNAYLYRKTIEWQWLPLWMIFCISTDFVSVLLLKHIGDQPIWYTLMGVIYVALAVYLLWGQKFLNVQPNKRSLVVLSIFYGFITGAFGVGGPLMAAFFLEASSSKEHYLGTTQVISVGMLGMDFVFRVGNGMFTNDLLGSAALGIAFMVAGLGVAKRLVKRMDSNMLRKNVCLVMIVNGIVLLLQ